MEVNEAHLWILKHKCDAIHKKQLHWFIC